VGDVLYYFEISSLSDKIYDASSKECKERSNDSADDSDDNDGNEKDSDAIPDLGTCHITTVS